MQTNFYGKAEGTSSSKYDVWLNCVLNSQSVNSNTSNVTIKLCLKRNDGYADSAYNLYENRNSVTLTVASQTKVNKTITIDTRNNVTVTLASWTGNVTHNDDGTLALKLSASFTMDNVTLEGASVSGEWSLPTIIRKSTLAFSSLTVNPGGTVTATISCGSSTFSHKIKWALGGESRITQLSKGVLTTSFTIPKEWAQEVTSSSKANLKVSLYTYNGSVNLGANSYTLSFIIPSTDEYKPSFDIGLVNVEGLVPSSIDGYVQNVSKLTVSADNLQLKYGATFSAVSIKVGSVTKRSTPSTFTLTDSGTVKIRVSVRDSRGFVTSEETSIEVCEYTPASVEILELFRCDSTGAVDKYGENLYVKYKTHFSSVNGQNFCNVTAQYKTTQAESFCEPVALSSEIDILGGGQISVSNSYTVRFTVSDALSSESHTVIRTVSSGNIPFNIKSGGTGAAFGKFSERDNELSLGWNLSVDGNVNINGIVNFEDVSFLPESTVELVDGAVRYYPCFKGCFVSLRVKATEALSANTNYKITSLSDHVPITYTALSSFSNYSLQGQSNACITAATGDLIFRSDTEVPQNTYICISGFYLIN